MSSSHWTHSEVEEIVRDYLAMLAHELRGEPFNKAARNRALRTRLEGRSRGSVEFKHQNISSVLVELGYPYINGYKPLSNVQDILRGEVLRQLEPLSDLVKDDVEAPQAHVTVADVLGIRVDPPESATSELRERQADQVAAYHPHPRMNYLQQESLNRSLGDAGETLVMDYERVRLQRAGKDHLAGNVEQVSKTVGDHAGYDIRSYEVDGHDRFIEVKTTRYGMYTPFYMSAGEVRFSKSHASVYRLYRLFQFRQGPRLFNLPGDVEHHVRLKSVNYRAHF